MAFGIKYAIVSRLIVQKRTVPGYACPSPLARCSGASKVHICDDGV